jgi:RimJ/RimL family protein N-acetyltransferase
MHRTTNLLFETDHETGALSVSITTERLYLQSATSEDISQYGAVLRDAETMVKFGDGNPWDDAKVNLRLGLWADRWKKNDPFSSLAVFKNDDNQFIGHVDLGHGDEPGQSEMAYVFAKPLWGNGYGKEAVTAVVREYAPELVTRNYNLEGKPFTSIIATARNDNEASVKIIAHTGMKSISQSVMYGKNRHTFFIATSELVNTSNPVVTYKPN